MDTQTLHRFNERFQVSPEGCWLWARHLNPDGYGKFYVNGTAKLAHRFSYELFVGSIPDGLELDHLCQVRRCVNAEHLEAVTHAENMRRRYVDCDEASRTAKARMNREARKARLAAGLVSVAHGSESTYTNWGCRCPSCTDAHMALTYTRRSKAGKQAEAVSA